ncbi:unnamed protein product [Jaminaea pallidilutea]
MSGQPQNGQSAASASSSRPPRPKVVQPKPTNKGEAPLRPLRPAPDLQSAEAPSTTNGNASSSSSSNRASAPKIVTPNVSTGGAGAAASTAILVEIHQKGNPVLRHIHNIRWEFSAIPSDYQVGVSTGVLFLSLKYHRLHPDHIDQRIQHIATKFNLRLLLVQCDVPDPQSALKELTKKALVNGLTLLVAFNPEEAAGYLERYKMYEHKPPDIIRERRKEDWGGAVTGCLTDIKGVNKTDAVRLITQFGSLRHVSRATPAELSSLPGFGEIKVKRVREAFTTPFRVGERKTYREKQAVRRAAMESDQRHNGGEDSIGDFDEQEAFTSARAEQRNKGTGAAAAGMASNLQKGMASVDERDGVEGGESGSKDATLEAPSGATNESVSAATGGISLGKRTRGDLEEVEGLLVDDDDDGDLDLNEEEIRKLEQSFAVPPSDSRSEPQVDAPDGTAAPQSIGEEDQFGSLTDADLAGIDENDLQCLNEEEREELRSAMRMSMAP